ncbi:MAG TPA: glycoside hydrolase family 2 TIM barrel-domain containing protein [Mycobacteriales bacterium]|nr:glycoside hydrolase family 2 TIM barrel-domain containing protein [Mycobacteriales bacterium]
MPRPRSVPLVIALVGVALAGPGSPARASVPAGGPVAGAAAAAPAGAGSADTPSGAGSPGARTVSLDRGWRFALVNPDGITDPTGAFADAASPAYDDSGWRQVDVPHDWSIELAPRAGPGTTSGTGFLPGGLGWYRKTFTLPPALAGRRVSVEFDGVYMDSSVFLNGQLLGTHPYGYTGFAFDLTGAHADGVTPNVLAVQVRNQLPSSRWYSGSGIYRNVRLVVTGPVHVARWGTAVTTPGLPDTLPAGYATVHVETTVDNDAPGSAPATVVSTVRDGRGAVVERSTVDSSVAGAATVPTDIRVRRPVLWDVDRPYLYRLTTEVVVGRRVVDSYDTTFGIRYTRFEPAGGLFLNGRSIKLYGVNLHHDEGALGSVVNADAITRQLRLMRSMGVNAVRTSHNPPAPELVRACDELGLLLMVEAFDVWNVRKVAFDYARFFTANGDADITEMVRAARNSPSVLMWSIGNEIPNSTSASGVPIARRLIDDVRAADPSRPVVIGSDRYRNPPAAGSPAEQVLLMLDGVGLNYNTAASVDVLHARYPNTFFFESESSSETSARGEYDQPEQLNTGEDHTPGHRGASSYDNNLASWTMSGEYALKKDRDRPWFLGQFLWSGMDYIGEPTPFDVFPVKTSFFGAVDTAGFAKDQFYLFASQWTDRPMVHLLPADWTGHQPGDPVAVRAYSTVDTVELFLNGRSLGTRSFDRKTTVDGRPYLETTGPTGDDKTVTGGPFPGSYTSPNGSAGALHLSWTVPFEPGRLVAVARRGGAVVARDELATAGAPSQLRLRPDRRVTTADGHALTYVTAEILDARGVLVPGADDLVRIGVTGGTLVGMDSGRQESAELYRAPARTAYHGKVLAIVQAGDRPGPIRITATAAGLRPASTTVLAARAAGRGPSLAAASGAVVPPVPGTATGLAADASFSGAESTPPAAMLDGDPATGWSNQYTKDATALLARSSAARPADSITLRWPDAGPVAAIRATFTVDATHALPAGVAVSYWTGRRYLPARDVRLDWTGTDALISFAPVHTARIRLDLRSAAPETPTGFLRITELSADPPAPVDPPLIRAV